MTEIDTLWDRVTKNRELRAVAGNLLGAAGDQPVRTILVTSCRRGEGRTTAAVSLAWALADGGHETILVDTCASSPGLHRLFPDLEAPPTLADMNGSAFDLSKTVRPTRWPRLFVAHCGPDPKTAAQAVGPAHFQRALEGLSQLAHHVVADADPILTSSHALTLVPLFDGVVLAVECGRTKWEVVEVARDKLLRAGGRVLGVVLNRRRYHVPDLLYSRV